MRIFLSYASQDRAAAEAVHQALAADGHDVFFDREDLPAGESYDSRIRQAVAASGLFVILLSPDAVDAGSYTLNEVDAARTAWPNVSGHVLPVLLRPTPFETIPDYLKSVTVLQTEGNLAAAVVAAVARLAAERRRRLARRAGWAVLVAAVAAGVAWWGWHALQARRGGAPMGTVDRAPLVAVPAGRVVMGDDRLTALREKTTGAFLIDEFEVTTARYAKFLASTGAVQPPPGWDELDLDKQGELPVVGVSWAEAQAYCRWAGRRLPTEVEWERAARGDDGRPYPWGGQAPTPERANAGRTWSDNPYADGLAPVGSHPQGASPFGVQDMAGNAAEWLADAEAEGEQHMIHGGGWTARPDELHAGARFHAGPGHRGDDTGFRCAQDAPP